VAVAAGAGGRRGDRRLDSGHGGSAAYITLRGDRADMPGAALSYIVLGAIWIAGAIFAGDAFHTGPDAVPYILFAASVITVASPG
jgi:hypothetical protein